MSYDLCCWRPIANLPDTAQSIYERLRVEEEEVQGLEWLPVAEIAESFLQAFPLIEVFGTGLIWQGKNGNVEVSWPIGSKPHHTLAILVDCSWGVLEDPDIAKAIMQAVADMRCVLYDPQQERLYEEPEFWSA